MTLNYILMESIGPSSQPIQFNAFFSFLSLSLSASAVDFTSHSFHTEIGPCHVLMKHLNYLVHREKFVAPTIKKYKRRDIV
jgi:hypothetical protein